MTRICCWLTLCSAAHLLLASGCGPAYLQAYTPIGPSADPYMFQILTYWPWEHFVVNNLEREGENLTAYYKSEIDLFHQERLQQPAFRSLCALINTYFQDWDRLVIIERVGYWEQLWYGYVVLGVTPDGPKVVTNMVADKGWRWGWEGRLEPRRLRVNRKRVEGVLEELDRMEKFTSTSGLIWFDGRNMPMYILHDVRRDGQEFTFGIRGYGRGEREWREHELASYFMDDEAISNLLGKNPRSECVLYKSPRGSELKKVGASYAVLMARVWKSIMGLEDAGILGDDDEVAPLD